MPQIPIHEPSELAETGAYRVLVTGFGPFSDYQVNPSWLAVKPLQNLIILPENITSPVTFGKTTAFADKDAQHSRPIHVTVVYVPVVYDFVLSNIPGLHTRPPVLPSTEDESSLVSALPEPPVDGYDLVIHVGAGRRGNLRIEKLAHKLGYNVPDVEGRLPPRVNVDVMDGASRMRGTSMSTDSEDDAERFERDRAGGRGMLFGEQVLRGFGKGYEEFAEELGTDIDVDGLIEILKKSGVKNVEDSSNAGRYLCDFTYYCSLANALRARKKASGTSKNFKPTKVLFMHCPPVGEPLDTEYVTNALKHIIVNVCTEQ